MMIQNIIKLPTMEGIKCFLSNFYTIPVSEIDQHKEAKIRCLTKEERYEEINCALYP